MSSETFHWWYIVLGIFLLVIIGTVGWKVVQRTESSVYEAGSQPVSPKTWNFGLFAIQPGCVSVKALEKSMHTIKGATDERNTSH